MLVALPAKPGGHLQAKSFTPSMQSPSFVQASFISPEKHVVKTSDEAS